MRILTFLLFTLVIMSCDSRSPEEISIIYLIEQQRKEKNMAFKSSEQSPLLSADKAAFSRLDYYPVNLSLRFEGPITMYDTVVVDTILGTRGDKRPGAKIGFFEFEYQGNSHRLQVYKMFARLPGQKDHLFLGFTDKTSGDETYGGGRYIDIAENRENHYIVDFNQAYNPFCVYNPRFSCAIPSLENRLKIAVRAGEKQFQGDQ